MNGKVTNFADYSSFLESENILIQARNFLVFQGDVEAIASKSPKDLTRLIEKISGSDELREEYERLKDAMEKATEAATYAFNKKRSLSNEIKSVQDQKEDVSKYERLVLQRMDLISEQVMWRLFHIEAAAKENVTAIENLQEQIKAAERENEAMEAEVKEKRKAVARIQKEQLALEKQLKKAQSEVDSTAPESLELEEKLRFLTGKVKNLQSSKQRQQESLARHETDIVVAKRELADLQASQRAFEEAHQRALAQSSLSPELMSEYGSLKEQAAVETAQERLRLEALEHTLAPTTSTLKQKSDRQSELSLRLSHITRESEPLEAKKRSIADEISETTEERRQLQRSLAQNQSERAKLQQAEVETQERLRAVMEKLLQAKIEKEESEREIKLRATIESLRRMFPGVHGRLVDLCTPTSKRFEGAALLALGKHSDSIIVDSEQTAIDCIQYMRQQRSGQATFLPLDTLQTRAFPERLRTLSAGARPLIDVLSFDASLTRAFQYACGSTLVCDSIDIAKSLCYEGKVRAKAVTLDGMIIHKNGFLSGGAMNASGKASSSAWDEKNISKLKNERDSLLVSLSDCGKALKRLEGEQKIRASLAEKESRIQFLNEEMTALDRALQAHLDETSTLQRESSQLAADCAALQASTARQQAELSELKEVIKAATERVFADFCRRAKLSSIASFEEAREAASTSASQKLGKFAQLMAKLENQISFLQRECEEVQERLIALEEQIASEESSLAAVQREKAKVDASQAVKLRALNDLKTRQSELNEQLEAAQAELAEQKRSNQSASSTTTRLNKEITALECAIERHMTQRNSLLKKCRLEEIDLPLAKASLLDISLAEVDVSEAASGIVVDYTTLGREAKARSDDAFEATYTDKIRELSEEIDRLAPNLRALDKLDSAEARLRSTMASFEESKQEAKRARDEFMSVRNKRHRLFTKAFKHISEAIDPIYKELTRSETVSTGGTAYLSLEDSDEPYCEGIKFHAMPPMKRFLDMEQLSGGERTVAALALLFAIHSFRPAPFFILDEIDAALDNANVQRVAAFIRAKAPQTQFIVISLKGSLYERAESLIGIYRDPQEIASRVLSLKLTDYAE